MRTAALALTMGLVLAAGAAHAVPEKKREKSFPKDGHIHGYLVDPAGQGLCGWVALTGLDGCKYRAYYTDGFRRGRFDIDNVQPGRYKLHVENFLRVDSELVPPEDLEIEVRPDHVIRPHLVARCER